MLFILRTLYRSGRIIERFVEASDLEQAAKVGHAWCEGNADHRYVGVEKAIVADASILKAEQMQKPARVGA